jgi:hypothetical protein
LEQRFDSLLVHQTFLSTLIRRQVVEKWRRYGSSIESDSVERDPFWEEQLLATRFWIIFCVNGWPPY